MRELRKETETWHWKDFEWQFDFIEIRNERTPKGDGNKSYMNLNIEIDKETHKK